MEQKYQETVLKNGFSMKAAHCPGAHNLSLALFIRCGTAYEDTSNNGISHLLEQLCFRKAGSENQKDFYYEMEKIGGTLTASTYYDHICFNITVLPEYIKEAFQILTKVLLPSELTFDEIEHGKRIVIKEIENRNFSFTRQARKFYYQDTRLEFPVSGTVRQIRRMNKKMIDRWKKIFFAPSNSCLIITGEYEDSVLEEMKKHLETLPPKPYVLNCSNSMPEFCNRTVDSDVVLNQAWDAIDIGIFFDIDKNKISRFEAEYLHSILGGGLGARMQMFLRETIGYTDQVFSEYYHSAFENAIYFEITVSSRDIVPALNAMFRVFSETKYSICQRDMDCTSSFYTRNQKMLLDFTLDYALLIGNWNFLLHEDFTTIDRVIENYQKITLERMRKVAEMVLWPKNMTVVLINNPKAVTNKRVRKALLDGRRRLVR